MRLRLEPTSGVPLGLQIVRQIRLAVASGRIEAGGRLPSARDLAAELRVNFHTVRKAFADLQREGILKFERGKGTYVADEIERLDSSELRRVVRAHVERLAEDLAGHEVSPEDLEALVEEELVRAFGPRRVKR